jgi:hypothetical protein
VPDEADRTIELGADGQDGLGSVLQGHRPLAVPGRRIAVADQGGHHDPVAIAELCGELLPLPIPAHGAVHENHRRPTTEFGDVDAHARFGHRLHAVDQDLKPNGCCAPLSACLVGNPVVPLLPMAAFGQAIWNVIRPVRVGNDLSQCRSRWP